MFPFLHAAQLVDKEPLPAARWRVRAPLMMLQDNARDGMLASEIENDSDM